MTNTIGSRMIYIVCLLFIIYNSKVQCSSYSDNTCNLYFDMPKSMQMNW